MRSAIVSFNDKKKKLLGYRAFLKLKKAYQLLRMRPDQKKMVLVLGCQRSGTTLMARIFNRDFRSNVYTAFSPLSSKDPHGLRLNPLDEVERQLKEDTGSLVVLKPIVESQNAGTLLDFFNNSKAIWMFRNCRDVVASNIRRFGDRNGIDDLRPIVQDRRDDWRADKVSKYTREIIADFFSEEMDIYDAAALFWFSRNRLFFELDLDKHPGVMTCHYDDLVTCPDTVMRGLYHFIDHRYPGNRIVREVKPTSIGKGTSIGLSHEVEMLCLDLYARLREVHKSKLDKTLLV